MVVPTQLPAIIFESDSHQVRLVGTGRTTTNQIQWTIEIHDRQDSMGVPLWRPYEDYDHSMIIKALVEQLLK